MFTLLFSVCFLCADNAIDYPKFIRGDANRDSRVNIADAVSILQALFGRKIEPLVYCIDSGDANDDGKVNIADPIYILNYLFLGSDPPKFPFPHAGEDTTEDQIFCNG